MSDELARLFIALELPEPIRTELVCWLSGAESPTALPVRRVPLESLHVTLCFLGSLRLDAVTELSQVCEQVAAEEAQFALTLGTGVWLPPRRPRVLAVEIAESGARLARFQARLAERLSDGGWYRPEPRPFLAHVTVARVQRGQRVRAAELAPPEPVPFSADRVTLFRSRLGGAGSRYEPLHVVRLSARFRKYGDVKKGHRRMGAEDAGSDA